MDKGYYGHEPLKGQAGLRRGSAGNIPPAGCKSRCTGRLPELPRRVVRQRRGKESVVRVGLGVNHLCSDLFRLTGGWPKRVGDLLFAEGADHRPLWLPTTDALFAWIGGTLGAATDNPVRWPSGPDKVSQAQLFAALQQTAGNFEAVEPLPHWPPLARHFYLHLAFCKDCFT
jgi:hypothetical protein